MPALFQYSRSQLLAVDFENIDGDTEREMFQRVQNGVALTPAEKLQALSSPWVEWINTLQRKYVTEQDGFWKVNSQ